MYRHTNIHASQQPWLIILNKTFDFDTSDSFTINNTCIHYTGACCAKQRFDKSIDKQIYCQESVFHNLDQAHFGLDLVRFVILTMYSVSKQILYTTHHTPQNYFLILRIKWNTHLNSMYEQFINIWKKIFNFGFFFFWNKKRHFNWLIWMREHDHK